MKGDFAAFQRQWPDDARARLRMHLDLVFAPPAERENVIELCVKQLQHGPMSPETLQKEFDELEQQNIDRQTWEKWKGDKVECACREAASAAYVRDCDIIALYRLCDSGKIRQIIRDYCWSTYKPWDRAVDTVAKHYRWTREDAESRMSAVRRDYQRFEHFERVVSSYKPAEGATFAHWVVSEVLNYIIPDIEKIRTKEAITGPLCGAHRDDPEDSVELPAVNSAGVEDEADQTALTRDLRRRLRQLREQDPEAYAVFILYAPTKRELDIDTEIITEGLSFIEDMRKGFPGRPGYHREDADAIWARFGNLPLLDLTWREQSGRQEMLKSAYAEPRVRELEFTSGYRVPADMEAERDGWNEQGRPDKVQELDFMIVCARCRRAEKAKFDALKNLTELRQEEIHTLLCLSQAQVSKKWGTACSWFGGDWR